jgi:hypothetical protein
MSKSESDWKRIIHKLSELCENCNQPMPKGREIYWSPSKHRARHIDCLPRADRPAIDNFLEDRKLRDAQRKAATPATPETDSTHSPETRDD